MALTLITPPASEPVTLADVKVYAQVELNDDDTLLTDLIVAARELVEADLQRQIGTATWDERFDEFPTSNELRLSRPPLQSVTSVKYIDTAGVEQTWSSSEYAVDTYSEPGRILLNYGGTWPATRNQKNAVTVRFVCGYPDAEIPEGIKTIIKSLVKLWYDQPNPVVATGAQPQPIPMHVQSIIDAYRNYYEYV